MLDVQLVQPVAVAVGVERPGLEGMLPQLGVVDDARPSADRELGRLGRDQVGVEGVARVGFQVDVPYRPLEARFDWFTNVDQLADGKGVGIDWTSSNLNNPWFGGSRFIPNKDQCDGPTWRKLIVDGLNQAAAGVC